MDMGDGEELWKWRQMAYAWHCTEGERTEKAAIGKAMSWENYLRSDTHLGRYLLVKLAFAFSKDMVNTQIALYRQMGKSAS